MEPDRQFPWSASAVFLLVGVPAFALAFLCALYVWTYTGPQFDIVFINDHQIGGTFNRVIALVLATIFGAAGIFSFLSFRRRMADWQQEQGSDTRQL
jgi:hypothetical protein